MKKFFNKWK